jgi:hypothetical protein
MTRRVPRTAQPCWGSSSACGAGYQPDKPAGEGSVSRSLGIPRSATPPGTLISGGSSRVPMMVVRHFGHHTAMRLPDWHAVVCALRRSQRCPIRFARATLRQPQSSDRVVSNEAHPRGIRAQRVQQPLVCGPQLDTEELGEHHVQGIVGTGQGIGQGKAERLLVETRQRQ